jgi:hypothetical protein
VLKADAPLEVAYALAAVSLARWIVILTGRVAYLLSANFCLGSRAAVRGVLAVRSPAYLTTGAADGINVGLAEVTAIEMGRSIGICIGFAVGIAMAHEGMDPLAAWYRSLTTADGKSCCSMHDCAPAEARMKEGRWEVLILPYDASNARWVAVPDRAVLRRENPDGRPILCRTPNGFIHCFVPPAGT